MGMYIAVETQTRFGGVKQTMWRDSGIRYQGLLISNNRYDLLQDNEKCLLYSIENQLMSWDKLSLSWFGWRVAIIMKNFPQVFVLFFFKI